MRFCFEISYHVGPTIRYEQNIWLLKLLNRRNILPDALAPPVAVAVAPSRVPPVSQLNSARNPLFAAYALCIKLVAIGVHGGRIVGTWRILALEYGAV